MEGDEITLIDFNVFGPPTNALLFDWNELIQKNIHPSGLPDGEEVDYRVVLTSSEVLVSEKGLHRGPIDVSLSSDFKNFMSICQQQQMEASDDEN